MTLGESVPAGAPSDAGGRGDRLPWALALLALILYILTLAPGVQWGDAGKFQRMAWQREVRFDEAGHPIWVLLVHPLARWSGLDPARAANLSSALLSALALVPAFRLARAIGAGRRAAGLCCLALAVSHTWWLHAVVAEVYALNSLVSLLLLRACLAVSDGWGRPPSSGALWRLGAAAGVFGGNHPALLLWLPGLAVLVATSVRAGRASRGAALAAAAGLAIGLAPFVAARAAWTRVESTWTVTSRLLAGLVAPFQEPRLYLEIGGYLLYQFPLPLVPLAAAAGAFRLWRRRRSLATALACVSLANLLFVLAHDVKDRFAFCLPVYLLIAVTAAPGLEAIDGLLGPMSVRARRALWAAAWALAVGLPPLAYHQAPALLAPRLAEGPGLLRGLPHRDAAGWYLRPGKRGDAGARRFAEESLAHLPAGSVLIADHTPAAPIEFLIAVEGRRPDVTVFWVPPAGQLANALRATAEGRPVFIAATDSYYAVEDLMGSFHIEPAGPIHRLVPRSHGPAGAAGDGRASPRRAQAGPLRCAPAPS